MVVGLSPDVNSAHDKEVANSSIKKILNTNNQQKRDHRRTHSKNKIEVIYISIH